MGAGGDARGGDVTSGGGISMHAPLDAVLVVRQILV